MHILIAGAGLAGMTAAWRLSGRGHDVTVFEATDRVGGRTWSATLDNGTVTERGGEYIFPGEFAARRLAAELELPIVSHGVTYARRSPAGRRSTMSELTATMHAARAALEAMEADGVQRVSVADAFREALGPDYERDPIYRRTAISLIVDPAEASAAATLRFESSALGTYLEDGGHVYGGNQRICLAIAERLPRPVRRGAPVSAVGQHAAGVEFTLESGEAVHGDAAVIAVPLPILRRLDLDFALTPAQQAALDHRVMGVAAKLGVPVSSAVSDPAVQSGDGMWWSWQSMAADGEGRIGALSQFAAGAPTLERLGATSRDAVPTPWLEELRRLRPGLEVSGEALLTTWADDPNTLGAYSAATPDWTPRDDAAFLEPAGRVAIAGEHTGSSQSISGAVASGDRAADALARVLDDRSR